MRIEKIDRVLVSILFATIVGDIVFWILFPKITLITTISIWILLSFAYLQSKVSRA